MDNYKSILLLLKEKVKEDKKTLDDFVYEVSTEPLNAFLKADDKCRAACRFDFYTNLINSIEKAKKEKKDMEDHLAFLKNHTLERIVSKSYVAKGTSSSSRLVHYYRQEVFSEAYSLFEDFVNE